MNYISIHLFKKVYNHALEEGMEESDFDGLSTPVQMIPDIKAVPADHFFELHERVEEHTTQGFAVRVGQEMKIEDYGVLGLSWRTCSWAGEIFDRCERYFKFLSNTYVFKVEKGTAISRVYLHRNAHRRGVELSNEATLSAIIVVLQAMTETNIAPVEVAFRHKAPKALECYNKAFKCPIRFNQTYNYIAYTSEDLQTRTAKADADINRFLVERVKEETEGMEVSVNKIIYDIEHLIRDALPSGIPSIHQIAGILGMSNRTLTRRLSENKLTFRDLIQKTQMDVASHLLKSTDQTVAEIGFETGFSEQSAFNRAFKRWTGKSPNEFRKDS